MRSTRSVALVALLVCFSSALAAPAAAQASPRAGQALSGLTAQPAVFVGPDRAWIFATESDPLPSVLCSDVMCRPVVRGEACMAPRCPGTGRLLFVSDRIAEVSDYPTDYQGFTEAQQELQGDARLAALWPYFAPHPSPPAPPTPPRPARFSYGSSDWWHLELGLLGGVTTGMVHITAPMWTADANLTLRFRPRSIPEDGLDLIYGTSFGGEIRVHTFGNVSGQSPGDFAVFVGLGPAFAYVDYDQDFRIPAIFSWLAPEFGLVVRSDGLVGPAWYVGWSVPATFLVDEHVGLEARVNLLVVDDWYPGDDAEVLCTLDVGVVLR